MDMTSHSGFDLAGSVRNVEATKRRSQVEAMTMARMSMSPPGQLQAYHLTAPPVPRILLILSARPISLITDSML